MTSSHLRVANDNKINKTIKLLEINMPYPNILRRYLASIIDLGVAYSLFYILIHSPLFKGDVKFFYFVFVFALYEPITTSFWCSLGQYIMRFRVRETESGSYKRVYFPLAIIRVIFKFLLGIFSFATTPMRKDRRSIHDLIAGTIVINASQDGKLQKQSEVGELHEASMNFDMENVEPFLKQVNENLYLDLDINKLVELTSSVPHDNEASLSLTVGYQGEQIQLIYNIFMDDINSPGLSFLTPSKQLSDDLMRELISFAKDDVFL